MIDYKELLQRHAADLFALDDTLKSLAYTPEGRPIIRYDRDSEALSAAEMYWCEPSENPPAGLVMIWSSGWCIRLQTGDTVAKLSKSYVSNSTCTSTPPKDMQEKAAVLLRELDKQRELLAMYHIGGIKGDKYIAHCSWNVSLPNGYEPDARTGAGATYTVTRDGTLGLAKPYTDVGILYALLGVYSYNSHNSQLQNQQ